MSFEVLAWGKVRNSLVALVTLDRFQVSSLHIYMTTCRVAVQLSVGTKYRQVLSCQAQAWAYGPAPVLKLDSESVQQGNFFLFKKIREENLPSGSGFAL